MNDNPLTRVGPSPLAPAPAASPAAGPSAETILRTAGYVVARSDGGKSGVANTVIASPEVAARIAAEADPASAAAEIDDILRGEVPVSASDYRMPERGPRDEPLDVPEVQRLQAAARAARMTQSEFATVVMAGRMHGQRTGGESMTQAERELAGDRMEAELSRFHGEDGAVTLSEHAMSVVATVKRRDPALGAALHDMILTSRPLLEMLARVGRRGAGRR
jgi:hypothetical protein